MEAVVLSVLKGEEAKANGGDVMILLEERPAHAARLIHPVADGPAIPREVYLEAMSRFAQHQKREEDRVARYGKVRSQISTVFQGYRFVVVGGRLYYDKKWKFFPDFLMDYVPSVFGKEWGEAELAKPEGERHPILQWRSNSIRFMNAQPPDEDGNRSAVPNGFMAAYLAFAYDLYTVADNGSLDDVLIHRLKNTDQFQGARHELFAEATCLRAGYTIEREDERDGTRRHAEFTARHIATGQLISVEAKSRHRPGILGQPGTPPPLEGFNLRFGELVNDALAKHPPHPLVVFIDTNLPTSVADRLYIWRSSGPSMPSRVMERLLERMRKEHSGAATYAALVFTNHPHHYGSPDEADPRRHLLSIMPVSLPPGVMRDALMDLHSAANLYGNIPNGFPDDQGTTAGK